VDSIYRLSSSLDQVRLALSGGDDSADLRLPSTALRASSHVGGSSDHIAIGISARTVEEVEEPKYEAFNEEMNVHMWIDVPNSFPWRKCLNKYVDRIITYDCVPQVSLGGGGAGGTSNFTIFPYLDGDMLPFCNTQCTM
jgi:hypothetical protein